MKRMTVLTLLSLITVALLTVVSCTSNPTAGTETGNPDITACLETALHTFDTLDAWLPSMYLPGGEEVLNPQRLTDEFSHTVVAKKLSSDTVDSSMLFYVVERKDTAYLRDTQYVNDTVILDTLITDTSEQMPDDSSGLTTFSARFVRHDTVFIRDTVFTVDTVIQIQLDTIPVKGSSDAPDAATNRVSQYIILMADSVRYSFERDSLTGAVTVVQDNRSTEVTAPAINVLTPEIRSGVSFLSVSRVSSTPAMTVTESYSYDAAVPPGMNYNDATVTPSLSHATISYALAASTTILEIDFDAGNDLKFPTTADNRISAFQRKTQTGAGMTDRISYGERYFGMLTDTLVLQREQWFANGPVSRETARFNCLHGLEDPADHRFNRLSSCSRQIQSGDGKFSNLSLSIVLQQPLTRGTSPTTADVSGTIDFGKGQTGIIDGIADFQAKVIYGTYAQAGIEYRFSYAISDTAVQLTRIE